MGNAFDLRAELVRVHDSAGAWAFIRGFFEHWSRPLRDGDGSDEAEIRQAEQRLGSALPEVLREGYRLCGGRDDLTRGIPP
jgi:cell wall assembly regulator SMI1